MQLRVGAENEPPDDTLELSPTIVTSLTETTAPYTFLFPDNRILLADTQYWTLVYRTDTSYPNIDLQDGGTSQPYSGRNATGIRPWTPEIGRIDILAEGTLLPGPPPYDLEIGAPAIDRVGSIIPGYTFINSNPLHTPDGDPPPCGGSIDKVEIWATEDLTNVIVGTFARDGNQFTNRDYAVIGNVPWGSKQAYDGLNILVEPGDCLGIYYAAGELDVGDHATDSIFYYPDPQFGTGPHTYTEIPNYAGSLYGYGWTFP